MEDNRVAGLRFHSTAGIQEFLDAASSSASLLPDRVSELALRYKDASVVPYQVIRDVWSNFAPEARPSFRRLLEGATFAFHSPKPREKPKELQERLQKLQELADQKAYKDLVKDVVKENEEMVPLSTYKDQIGFGLHVIVTMFTGFLLGFALFRSQFEESVVLHVAGGLIGLFAGMILETVLFIVRDYQYQNSSKFKKRRINRDAVRNAGVEKKRQ
ncbi:hypothetical protein SELMODRAFT_271067 [Selaginella moellendorffii]|uniref:Uncharacterized protein n=2 Tax=Selaginella moellendorffii TaxID=88036 RepID=D8RT40_SELML|nr:hypothetical protein SELMODRAFT_271067 [Selaginella moellendorffii]